MVLTNFVFPSLVKACGSTMVLPSSLSLPWSHKPPLFPSTSPFPPSQCRCMTTVSSGVPSNLTPHPAVILPGLGNNTGDYQGLQLSLQEYGIKSVVARVSRLDWFRNAAGLSDSNYWKGTLRPRPVLDWYLERVNEAVSEAKKDTASDKISLVGHSTGGWLARVYMEEFEKENISLLLTLRTPHTPPPKGVSGVIDQTRGLLTYVQEHCSKAVYTPELKYVCIAGRYIRGARVFGNADEGRLQGVGGLSVSESRAGSVTMRARFVGQGYKQVCGYADVWGDGVVTEVSAHLEGALTVSFDGVYHFPVGSDDVTRPWYGSPEILKKWVHHLQ